MSRTNLTKTIRNACWMQNCGSCFEHECFVGCGNIITPFTYECGHIQSVAEGGSNSADNLKPICSTCNKSMGAMHMIDYIEKCSFSPLWLQKQRIGSYKITFKGLTLTRSIKNPIDSSFRIIDGSNYTYLAKYPVNNEVQITYVEYVKDGKIHQADSLTDIIENISTVEISTRQLFEIRSISDVINDPIQDLTLLRSDHDLLFETCKIISRSILIYNQTDKKYEAYLLENDSLNDLNQPCSQLCQHFPIKSVDDFINFYKLYAADKIIKIRNGISINISQGYKKIN